MYASECRTLCGLGGTEINIASEFFCEEEAAAVELEAGAVGKINISKMMTCV